MTGCEEVSTGSFYSEQDTLALAQKVVKDGLIEQEVVDCLNSLHPQVPSSMKHRYLLECLRVQMKLSEQSSRYATVIKFTSSGVIDSLLYGPEHIFDLTELLLPFAHKWRFIGIALKFQPNDLDSYAACPLLLHDSPRSYLVRLLEDWVLKKFEHSVYPSQSSLEEALKSQTVGLGMLVSRLQQIKKKFSGCYYSVSLKKDTSTTLRGCINIAEGASTLLEANSDDDSHDFLYEWSQNGELFINKGPPSFLYLHKVDLDDDGCKFSCRISCGDSSGGKIIEPIILNVSCSLDKFRRNLALMYLSQPEIPKDAWPPVGNRKFINLTLIRQKRVNYGPKYARLTICGGIDDILHDKHKIQYNEVYESLKSSQLILIEGRPGSGKTTFVNKLTRDWAAKSAGGRIRLVLLVSLRVVNTMLNPGLSDLLKLFKDLNVSQELIEERTGKGVCFIFDSLDEFSPSDGTNSIVYKIIDKSYLSQSTVIVASRPAALSIKLRSKASKVIEVLGFLSDQIIEYFDSYPFSDTSKSPKLRTYLSTHPNILHMCYLPIHATMVAFLFEVAGQVPKTETEIYTHFTRSTLIRSLTKNEETEARLIDFDTLGSKQFKQICHLALDKTILRKQVLDEDEVGSYFHTEKDRDISLGLITIDRTADLHGYKNVYTFPHLTFQEYLAAYHISTLNKEEQIKIFQEHRGKDHMLVVWKFCCGLKTFDESIIRCSLGSTLFHIQCAYESQQYTVCEEVLKFMDFQIFLDRKYLSTPDFTAIGYLANTATVPFKLSLVNCNINLESIDALLSEINDKAKNSLQHLHMEAKTIEIEVIQRLLANLGSLKSIFVQSEDRIFRRGASQVSIRLSSLTELSLINDSLMLLDKLCYPELIKVNLKGSIQSCNETEILANGLQSCVNLRHLNISDNSIGDNGAMILAGSLKSCKKLERFNVSNSSISSSGIIAILDSIRPLNHLVLKSTDVCQYEVNHEDLLYFLEPFTNLQSLEITLNNVNCGLFWSKSRGWKNLEELYIIAQPEYNMDTALTVCDSFQFLHCLKKLTLRCCIKKVGGARALMSGLKNCPELQVLDLNHNIISPAGIVEITNNFNCLKNLQELHMCNCLISDSGAKKLSMHLQHLPSLQTLCLSRNMISGDGAKAVAASLQNCPQLQQLDLHGNKNVDSNTTYSTL